jgi:hypothetical protein
MARVLLDLNNPVFQEEWFALERDAALAVLATLRKISRLNGSNCIAIRAYGGKLFNPGADQAEPASIVFG